jgi:hypothetical protein
MLSKPQGLVLLGGLGKLKKLNYLVGTGTRDLPDYHETVLFIPVFPANPKGSSEGTVLIHPGTKFLAQVARSYKTGSKAKCPV